MARGAMTNTQYHVLLECTRATERGFNYVPTGADFKRAKGLFCCSSLRSGPIKGTSARQRLSPRLRRRQTMRSAKRTPLLLSLLVVGGCSSPSGTNSAKVADAIGTIKPSREDTCGTLKQIAEQTSKIETIRQGKEVVYKAPPCEPKTS